MFSAGVPLMAQSAVIPPPMLLTQPAAADGELLQFMEIYGSADGPDPQGNSLREQAATDRPASGPDNGALRSAATQRVPSSVGPLPDSAASSGPQPPTATPATASIATAAEQATQAIPNSSLATPHRQQATSRAEPGAAGAAKTPLQTPAAAAQPAPFQQIWQLLARFVGQRPPGVSGSDPTAFLQAQLRTRQVELSSDIAFAPPCVLVCCMLLQCAPHWFSWPRHRLETVASQTRPVLVGTESLLVCLQLPAAIYETRH